MKPSLLVALASLILASCGTDPIVDADAGAVDVGMNDNSTTEFDGSSPQADTGSPAEDAGEGSVDAGTEVDMNQGAMDASTDSGSPADAGSDAGDGADTGADSGADAGMTCDLSGFSVTTSEVDSIDTDLLSYVAIEGAETDPNYLVFDFSIFRDYGGIAEPQSFTFTGENYADCGLCVVAYECTPTTCGTTYLVESGSVDIAAAGYTQGAPFDASFADLVLREVTIDSNTLQSTPVPGGKTWCIDSLDATGTTTAN